MALSQTLLLRGLLYHVLHLAVDAVKIKFLLQSPARLDSVRSSKVFCYSCLKINTVE